jgi:hypothetical protein
MTFWKSIQQNPSTRIAFFGDIAMYLLATILGFLSHSGETESSFGRMAATFFPFLLSWIFIAPWLGAYDPVKMMDPNSVWHSALASLYAAPIGAFVRSLLLNSPTLPLFVIIMGGVTTGLIILWRIFVTRVIAKPDVE